ncbi:hypothetical protein K470DRAFT_116136 [Piedraia hortae CBS 480.64]|uniref:Uncharacterized protein n=1 Tax=Piedraia hortae CBS 480.64 TaxID=1314780 RepID=A0A6A7BVZ7_9PEZI|nr:hypothetical protein K470DRAFT_116136 [Piedraia hortae CBS 480.64]
MSEATSLLTLTLIYVILHDMTLETEDFRLTISRSAVAIRGGSFKALAASTRDTAGMIPMKKHMAKDVGFAAFHASTLRTIWAMSVYQCLRISKTTEKHSSGDIRSSL